MGKRSKTIIAVILVCTLSITAPLQSYRIESRAVVAEAVVIGAASVALMALAAFGVSYLVQGATAQETKDYIDTKIIEFKQYKGINNFPGEDPDDYKISPLGKIVFGLNAAKILKEFVIWLNGSSASVEQEVVYKGGYYDLGNGFKVYQVNQYYSGLSGSRISPYVNAEYITREKLIEMYPSAGSNRMPVGDSIFFQFNSQPASEYSTFQLKSGNTTHSSQRLYSSPGVGSYWVEIMPCITLDNYLFWDGCKTDGIYYVNKYADMQNDLSQTIGNENINTIEKKENLEMDLPELPEVGEGDEGIEFDNPESAPTTDLDANNVPVPLPAGDIFNNIFNSIEGNTENVTNYNPTYNIINNYSEQPNVNTDEYDEPLPVPEPEPLPDTGTVGEATDLIQDIYEWFIGLFPWDRMKTKFPFSIPYDMYLIGSGITGNEYDVLGGTLPTVTGDSVYRKANTAPVYTLSVPWGNNRAFTLELDFSIIDPIRPIIRASAGILFTAMLFLML